MLNSESLVALLGVDDGNRHCEFVVLWQQNLAKKGTDNVRILKG